jgi:hypothetical protein
MNFDKFNSSTMKLGSRIKSGQQRQGYRGAGPQGTWLDEAIYGWVKTRQVAISLTPGVEIVVTNASGVSHGYRDEDALVRAADSATRGNAVKTISTGTLSAPLTSIQATGSGGLVESNVFGWRVRISASINYFNFAPYTISVGLITFGASQAPSISTPVISFNVIARRIPIDILVLSPSNAGGVFTLVPGSSGTVGSSTTNPTTTAQSGLLISTATSNDSGTIESLNARDLMVRAGVGQNSQKRDSINYDLFRGIRDSR